MAIYGDFLMATDSRDISAMTESHLRVNLLVAASVAGAGLLVAGTLALWLHYGTAVFYEMIASGIAACF